MGALPDAACDHAGDGCPVQGVRGPSTHMEGTKALAQLLSHFRFSPPAVSEFLFVT